MAKKSTKKATPASAKNAAVPPVTPGGPRFAQPALTPDPSKFRTAHDTKGDDAAYKVLDTEGKTLKPLPFPAARGGAEPVLQLQDVLGGNGAVTVKAITQSRQIVFHALGDTGNTRSVKPQNEVTDKLAADFNEADPAQIPSFLFHLGDVVYSFGEAQYYYDQFYEPYRDYPRPIVAIAGNHDGMVAPGSTTDTLKAFLDNFCATTPVQTAEAGGLDRTAMIQPGVYYTLEAPFVRILALYSNRLEDPGVISSQGKMYPELTNVQLDFLKAALQRIASEKFAGAVIFAVHHPPYTTGAHGGSPLMLKEMDAICKSTGVWPHAVLSGHAHSYQRYTRATADMEIPYVIAGNGGHGLTPLTRKGAPPLRAPVALNGIPGVTFENYDDTDYGYLRVIANAQQLRIEYHPASDGTAAKTPDDSVTVDLASRKLVHFQAAKA
jgi:hypothetical protein